jgi:thiosulfate dehydrogenase [quinone] large subunit
MYVSAGKALALLRIGFGLYFTSYGLDKIMGGWLTSAGPITGFLFGNPAATPPSRGAVANAIPFYADFLNSVVQPNAQVFSYLVALGECTAGILLTLGLLTRLGSIIGMCLSLNYTMLGSLLANNRSIDHLFFLAELTFLLGAAGLVWGLDGQLRHALSGNPVTRWLAGLNRPAVEERPVHAVA